jgi:hypothetical protein
MGMEVNKARQGIAAAVIQLFVRNFSFRGKAISVYEDFTVNKALLFFVKNMIAPYNHLHTSVSAENSKMQGILQDLFNNPTGLLNRSINDTAEAFPKTEVLGKPPSFFLFYQRFHRIGHKLYLGAHNDLY